MSKKLKIFLGSIFVLLCVALFSIFIGDNKSAMTELEQERYIGQKVWVYNMNKHEWKNFSEASDEKSKEEIILQIQEKPELPLNTSYHLLTGNAQVPTKEVILGEGSQEFLIGKNLYSYYPANFEFYEIIFNGVKFVPKLLKEKDVKSLLKDFNIIKISELVKNNPLNVKWSNLSNKFVILNDTGEKFYRYYIIPNDSHKMKIETFSNEFSVNEDVKIRLQRLEGCTSVNPCYELNIKK